MRNLTGCLLRWRWLRCLCLLLVSSILLLNISIESKAAESNEELNWQYKEFTYSDYSFNLASNIYVFSSVGNDFLTDVLINSNYLDCVKWVSDNSENYVFDLSNNIYDCDVSISLKSGQCTAFDFSNMEWQTSSGTEYLKFKVYADYKNATSTGTMFKASYNADFTLNGTIKIKYAIEGDYVENGGSDGEIIPPSSGSESLNNRIYKYGNYTCNGDHYLLNSGGVRDTTFSIPLNYNFSVDSSYRISFRFNSYVTFRDLYNVVSEPVRISNDWVMNICGIDYIMGADNYGFNVSFDFVPLTSSPTLTFNGVMGGFFMPVDPTLSYSCVADYSILVSNITITKTSARTTNEILEDMELQDKVTQDIQKDQLQEQREQSETQKGIWQSIKDFFSSFFQNLIDSIIHVFVPTTEEMGDLFNRLNDFFAETFGFLYYPFDFIIEAFNIFLEADSETGLTFPGFSIMGHEVWPDMTYDLTSEPIVNTIFGYVRMGTGAMLAMWFVNYLRNFFDKRFGGGGS